MADKICKILGVCGSLRKGSYNAAALRAAVELVPAGASLSVAEIGDLPLYNDDVRQAGYPPAPERFRRELQAADALLFVTPEYNYSISGVLKNAIDWASRPPDAPITGKAAAVMGASPGVLGTARAQYQLRQMGVYLDLKFVNKPEVMISNAAQRFDAQGRLTDADSRRLIGELLTALIHQANLLLKRL